MMTSAFVLGIDGLPYTLTHRLIDEGIMPNMGRLLQHGQMSKLEVTVPDFSCVSWTSFYTGVNPGKHGIYGFQDFDPVNGEVYFPNALHCKSPALWHEVGNNQGRSIIVNIPNTYPAQPLRGKMVSGFISPEFDKACYPITFAQTLRSLGYRMDFDGQSGLGSPDDVKELLKPVFHARKDLIRHVIKNEYWDLAVCILTETDRLQHYYLHTLADPEHELHDWTKSFYQELDQFIGEVAELLDGRALLYMVSDHGFDVVKKEILLEPLLEDMGLSPEGVCLPYRDPDYMKQTKVFTLDPGRFYVNRKNSRFQHGIVEDHEAEEYIEMIANALRELRDPLSGQPIVNTIRTKFEGFKGDAVVYAPDLVAATNAGYYFKSQRFPEHAKVQHFNWEANHVWNDAILYTPFNIETGKHPKIWDVMPSVLSQMGVSMPDYVDGCNLSGN